MGGSNTLVGDSLLLVLVRGVVTRSRGGKREESQRWISALTFPADEGDGHLRPRWERGSIGRKETPEGVTRRKEGTPFRIDINTFPTSLVLIFPYFLYSQIIKVLWYGQRIRIYCVPETGTFRMGSVPQSKYCLLKFY